MGRKALLTIFLSIALMGCTGILSNHPIVTIKGIHTNATLHFNDFLDTIPLKELPLTIICGFETTLNDMEFNKNFQQFIPNGFEVAGRISADKQQNLILFGIIGDILYPYLFTFDKDGNKIDSIYLHISTCAQSSKLELNSWTVIEKNMEITMHDTARFYNYLETENDYIRTLDSIIITEIVVQMENSGRFIIKSETRKTK